MRGRAASERRGQRGVVLVIVAVLIVVLIGFVALVVDVGKLYKTRGELQNASDSAALAGASGLDLTAGGIDEARARAHAYANLHLADRTAVELSDGDIVFGHWDEDAGTFTPLGSDPADPGQVNAVAVITRREAGSGNAVVFDIAPVLGATSGDVRADAIAVVSGPRGECGFPLVVPDCTLMEPLGDGSCGHCLTYQDANTDTSGFTSLIDGPVSGPIIRNIIIAACYDETGAVAVDPVTGECTGTCSHVMSGDAIRVQNGNLMNTGGNNFCPIIQDLLRRGVPGGPAYPLTVRVPVLLTPPGASCENTQFSGTHQVAGFAAFDLLGAKCGNNDPGVFVGSSPCAPPSSGKYIVGALRCDLESPDPPGGGWFGIRSVHPRLVE